jgi:hypothetical protein
MFYLAETPSPGTWSETAYERFMFRAVWEIQKVVLLRRRV